jgi:hypothetical protein
MHQRPEESPRFYRYEHRNKADWTSFQASYRETDLWIRAQKDLHKEAITSILNLRHQLEQYISRSPGFLRSLQPLPDDLTAPEIVRQMLRASRLAGVGPMAAVAGAIAQAVAESLKPFSSAIIVENGGDCYLDLQEEATVGVYAGPNSPFKGKIALRFSAQEFPLSICTSSGKIGHSHSFGNADAVTVVAKDGALADAAATALANLVRGPADIGAALHQAQQISAVLGVLIIIEDRLGIWGDLELVSPLA